MSGSNWKSQKGISLVESLVGLSVLISFMAYALYSFSVAFEAYKLTEAGHGLLSELQVARLLAVTRNDQVQVLFLDDNDQPALCPDLVTKVRFVDTNLPSAKVRDDLTLPTGVRFSQMPAQVQPLIFDSRGSLANGLGNYDEANNAIVLENNRGKVMIRVSASGRIQLADMSS